MPPDLRVKLKGGEKRDLTREPKKLWNMKVTVIPIVVGALGTIPKGLIKGLEDLEIKKTSVDHPDNCIIKIGQNTEKCPGDLRRLAVAHTPGKSHQIV